MKRRSAATASVITAAVLLAACASKVPFATDVATTAAGGKDATAVTPPAADRPRRVSDDGYRARTRNGEELFCKRELLTGSRTQAVETCLTAAQLEKQRNNVEALMRNVRDMNNGRQENSNGAYNNVMGSRGRD